MAFALLLFRYGEASPFLDGKGDNNHQEGFVAHGPQEGWTMVFTQGSTRLGWEAEGVWGKHEQRL